MIETVAHWLETENCFPWFAGSGLDFIFWCAALGFCITVCASKKVRKMFF